MAAGDAVVLGLEAVAAPPFRVAVGPDPQRLVCVGGLDDVLDGRRLPLLERRRRWQPLATRQFR
ncbi:hypothetical protein [Streptomyces sp. NPDC002573]|uniref:hypothetical protein n=1 Tax=Streptomyces sp. NPDC002573 TaxID=3364651 RepID=UPI0036CBD706